VDVEQLEADWAHRAQLTMDLHRVEAYVNARDHRHEHHAAEVLVDERASQLR
jgi:hypothetical protein